MSSFYQYDTRGASHADQIINLERMVEERDAEIERLREERAVLWAERGALKAARIAYASEFPPNADGEPDVGNIHANIRLLKKQCAERDGLLREALDRENRYVMPLYRDINYAARLRRALDIDPNDYYKIEDTGS